MMKPRISRLVTNLLAVALLASIAAPAPALESRVAEADRCLAAGEYGRAVEIYRDLVRRLAGSSVAGLNLRLSAAYLKREDPRAALGAADAAAAEAPSTESYAMRSLAFFRAGRFRRAEEDCSRALGSPKAGSLVAHFADARLLASRGQYDRALASLGRALEGTELIDRVLRPDELALQAEVLDELGRPAEALAALEGALAASPKNNDVAVANLTAQVAFRRSTAGRPLTRVAGGPDAATLGLSFVQGLPVVAVSVNGAEPAPFIVDTGAGICVLFEKYARKAGVARRPETAWAGAVGGNGRVELHYGLADTVSLGPMRVENVPCAQIAWELPQIAGIVGLPLLRPFLTTIDYRAAEMRLARGKAESQAGAPRDGGPAGSTDFRLVGNAIFVETTVNGRGPFNFQLDTGASGNGVPTDVTVASSLGLMPHAPNARKARGSGAAGFQEATVYESAKVSWAGLPPVTVDLISQRISPSRPERREGESGLVAETEVEGLVGYALLSRSVVTIDFDARRVLVR